MAKSYVKKMLDLSTSHLPSWDPDFGGLRTVEDEYGWVLFVSPGIQMKEVPAWLRPIHNAAVKNGAFLINFDRDANPVAEFKTYKW